MSRIIVDLKGAKLESERNGKKLTDEEIAKECKLHVNTIRNLDGTCPNVLKVINYFEENYGIKLVKKIS